MNVTTTPVIVNCFCTDDPGLGSPAGVVVDFNGDDNAKQALACELELPAMVFMHTLDLELPVIEHF